MHAGFRYLVRTTSFLLAVALCSFGSRSLAQSSDVEPIDNKRALEQLRDWLGPGVLPDAIYLKNSKGEPVLVPQVQYEEFERVLANKDNNPTIESKTALSQFDLDVIAEKEFAHIKLRTRANILEGTRKWRSIPLALSPVQWTRPIKSERPASSTSSLNDVDGLEQVGLQSQGSGYEWRLAPSSQKERTLVLGGVTKVTVTPSGYSLKLDLPSTPVQIRFRLPLADWELAATGNGNEIVEPFQSIDGSSETIVRTSGPSVLLSWKKRSTQDTVQAIEVVSQTKYTPTPDGRQFRIGASLSIRGPNKLGGRRFLIQLPVGSIFRESPSLNLGFAGYRIVRQSTNDESNNEPIVLSLELEEAIARNDIDIPLEWQMDLRASEKVRLSAPQIEGVQRHSGSIDCVVPKTAEVDWQFTPDARLTRQSQATDGSDSIVYGFQFEQAPASIEGKWSLLARRPRIREETIVELQGNRLLMHGVIEFQSEPMQLALLQLEWENWIVERVTVLPSQNDVDISRLVQLNETRAALPISPNYFSALSPESSRIDSEGSIRNESDESPSKLSNGANSSQRSTPDALNSNVTPVRNRIEFQLSRSFDENDHRLNFSLPSLSWIDQETQQRVTRSFSGKVALQSTAYDFEIDESTSPGISISPTLFANNLFANKLIANKLNNQLELSSSLRSIQEFQVAESRSTVVWNGKKSKHSTSTTMISEANIMLSQQSISCRQEWSCQSFNGTPAKFVLGVPSLELGEHQLMKPTSVDLTVNGGQIDTIVDESRSTASDGTDPRMTWYQCDLPMRFAEDSKNFMISATLQYENQLSVGTRRQIEFPLMTLESSTDSKFILANDVRVHVTCDANVQCEIRADKSGDRYVKVATSASQEFFVATTNSALNLTLTARDSSPEYLKVQSAWLQSILNAINQQDRYVVRFDSDQNELQVELPFPNQGKYEFILNGTRAVALPSDSMSIARFDLTRARKSKSGAAMNEFVLEIFMTGESGKDWIRHLRPSVPKLIGSPTEFPLVWQVVVPRTENIVASASQLAPLYRWQWQDLIASRKSEWTQSRLEQELGATRQPIAPEQANQYALLSIGHHERIYVVLVPSPIVWLPTAIVILFVSVAMMERRWIRWPWLWLIIALSAITFSQYAWDLSMVVAQASIGAVAIALIYGFTSWLVDRRARRRSIFSSRTNTITGSALPRNPILPGSNVVSGSSVQTSPAVNPIDPSRSGDGS